MGSKAPSKYCSLKFLLELKENYYCVLDRGIDYEPSEVDDLIYQKQHKINREYEEKSFKEMVEEQDERDRALKQRHCTNCRKVKKYGEFHRASDQSTGRRSHCKECRKVPF